MKNELKIDVFFDFICPWCLIGKRHLQDALNKLRKTHPKVIPLIKWHGVQLIPQIPMEGIPFNAFYLRRLGSQTAIRMRQLQVREAAKAVNVNIDFESIMRMPNTAMAHNMYLAALKTSTEKQSERFLEGIFSAYFHHGEDIGNKNTLQKVALYCGLSEELIKVISKETTRAFASSDTGGKGVPYFLFNGKVALAGAKTSDVLYDAIIESLEFSEHCA